MSVFVFPNNVKTTLADPITSTTATTCTLSSSANLPTLSAGEIFAITFNDVATGLVYEVCYCSAHTGAVLTIIRGQEGTSAQTWLATDLAYCSVTAGVLSSFTQDTPGATPLDTSATAQTKVGALTVNGGITSSAGISIGGALTNGTTGQFSGIMGAANISLNGGTVPSIGDLGLASSTSPTNTGRIFFGNALATAGEFTFDGTFYNFFAVNGSPKLQIMASTGGLISAGNIIASSSGATAAFVPPVYNNSGAALAGTTHIVQGQATISVGSGAAFASQTVTLSGAAIFTSSTSYVVTVSLNSTGSTFPTGWSTNSLGVSVSQTSGSSFSVFVTGGGATTTGTGTIVLNYVDIGS
jgi:hypothetical protein